VSASEHLIVDVANGIYLKGSILKAPEEALEVTSKTFQFAPIDGKSTTLGLSVSVKLPIDRAGGEDFGIDGAESLKGQGKTSGSASGKEGTGDAAQTATDSTETPQVGTQTRWSDTVANQGFWDKGSGWTGLVDFSVLVDTATCRVNPTVTTTDEHLHVQACLDGNGNPIPGCLDGLNRDPKKAFEQTGHRKVYVRAAVPIVDKELMAENWQKLKKTLFESDEIPSVEEIRQRVYYLDGSPQEAKKDGAAQEEGNPLENSEDIKSESAHEWTEEELTEFKQQLESIL
jgi:hypothetical protein